MDKPRSKIIIATIIIVMICVTIVLSLLTTRRKTETASDSGLPAPELAEGIRGSQFGIDKNINESTIVTQIITIMIVAMIILLILERGLSMVIL